MSTSIRSISEAFHLLYCSFFDQEFRKSLKLNRRSERQLLLLVRTFLLGYFGRVQPEFASKLPGKSRGQIDFVIDGVAVEFAVRRPSDGKAPLSARVNSDEVKKLMLYRGRAVLVLFDFSLSPYDKKDLDRFRHWPSLGKGNHRKSPFNLSYHHIRRCGRKHSYEVLIKNIRVKS